MATLMLCPSLGRDLALVAFHAEHFDEASGDFIGVSCGSSFEFTYCLPGPLKSPNLAEPFVALRLGESAVVPSLVMGWKLAQVAFPEKQNEFAVQT